ncbi:MAG: class I SAM-dependent rRNA methyltransferase [Myxococcota bacterium]
MLRFRLSGREQVLGTWLAELFPQLDRDARRRVLAEAVIRVEGRPVDRAGFVCPAGARVEIEALPSDLAAALRGPLEAQRDGLFVDASEAGEQGVRYRVLVDEPAWFRGALSLRAAGALARPEAETGEPPSDVDVEVESREAGLATLLIHAESAIAPAKWAEALSRAGAALVGDLFAGGLALPPGAPRAEAWPQPGEAARDEGAQPGFRLEVSEEAARAIRKGHAWLLPDEASERADRFQPGSLLRVMDRAGRGLGWAHAEGDARMSARVWSLGEGLFKEADSVEARVARALSRRRPLLMGGAEGATTEAFRLIHGEGDALPGLFVDRLGPLLRVRVAGRACEGFKDRALAALQAQLPVTPEGLPWSVLEVVHLRDPSDRARGDRLERVRWLAGGPEAIEAAGYPVEACGFWVRERGLAVRVVPGWDDLCRTRPGYGLFVDQRENRDRLVPFAERGGRWLNLFAHTGAFSASLLAAGADEVVSVDLSAAYLEDLEANVAANRSLYKEGHRHVSVRGDGRRYLETREDSECFDGIVLDPPTAAAAGRRFWSVRRDLEPILKDCVALLAEGGVLLVTQNQAGPPLGLERLLERIVSRAHRAVRSIEPAPAGRDHPSLRGFPEGDPFEGVLLELE